MTHGKTQEADMKTIHEIPEPHTCLRAIANTPAMIHARDTANDTIPENVGRNNDTDQIDSSHLAITGDKTAKT